MAEALIRDFSLCPACAHPGIEKYCGKCGEKLKPDRITLRYILDQWVDVYLGIETGLIHTFICLFRNPGALIRSYFSGNRQPYYKPMKYALLMASFTIVVTLSQKGDHLTGTESGKDQLFQELYVMFRENMSMIMNLVVILQFPIAALFTWWRNRRSLFTYGEHLYVNAFIAGQLMACQLIFDAVYWVSKFVSSGLNLDVLYPYLAGGYFAYVYSSWIHGRIRWPRFILTFIFSSIVFISSYIVAVIICFFCMYLYSILFLRH
jgi:hypothetical protein